MSFLPSSSSRSASCVSTLGQRAYTRPVTVHSPLAPLHPPPRAGRGSRSGGAAPSLREQMKPMNKGDIVEPEAFKVRSAFHREPPRPPRAILGPSKQDAQLIDPFFRLSISPLHEYKNARLLSSFTSETGRIKGRAETGLTWKSQRQVGQAIRRARMMGMMHRWQNKDPFAERGVPWIGEAARGVKEMRELPLQARLSALGRPGGMSNSGMLRITGFQRPSEEPVEGGGQPAIEAPKGSGVFGLASGPAKETAPHL